MFIIFFSSTSDQVETSVLVNIIEQQEQLQQQHEQDAHAPAAVITPGAAAAAAAAAAALASPAEIRDRIERIVDVLSHFSSRRDPSVPRTAYVAQLRRYN